MATTWGPGHNVTAEIIAPEVTDQVALVDNVDGTYGERIFISHAELQAGIELRIRVDDEPFAERSLAVPGFNRLLAFRRGFGDIAHDTVGVSDATVAGTPLWQPDGGVEGRSPGIQRYGQLCADPFVIDPR